MSLLLFSLYSISCLQAQAKPVKLRDGSSVSGPATVGFVSQNGGRDTLSLLFSCLLTLLLCVYSAVHLNVPPKGEPSWKTRLQELKWCIIGLFGPELVIFVAWRQWSSASALKSEVARIAQRRGSVRSVLTLIKTTSLVMKEFETQQVADPQWTLVHGYYSTMGGFVIDNHGVSKDDAEAIFGDRKYLTITARGIALLADCGYIPCMSEGEIQDKSKADTLTRLLVCIQAGWFFAQVISRLASGLPITLLEVNTLGHVACAFVMYLIWWYKPRQIKEPTILRGDWVAPLCAYMLMASTLTGRPHKKLPFHHCSDDAEFGYTTFTKRHARKQKSTATSENPPSEYTGYFHPSVDSYPLQENKRWTLAAQAVEKYTPISDKLACLEHEIANCDTCSSFRLPMEELVALYISDWPTEQLLRRVDSLIMGAALWSATVAYGAIHTAAWHSFFSTVLEEWLWHSSSIFVLFSGLLWVFINSVAKLIPQIDAFWIRFLKRKTPIIADIVILLLCTICGISYIFSRAYLVIEAFVNLRKLPITAYETPSWIQVLPHL